MKWLRPTLIILLLLSLLLTGLWWEENWRGRKIWEETTARLRALGEPVELADIIPPPIPDEENVAAAPIFAELFADKDNARLTKYVDTFAGISVRDAKGERMWRPQAKPLSHEDMSHLDEWRDYMRACLPTDVPTAPMTAEDEIMHYLSPWDGEMREVREALERPGCRWPLRHDDGVFAVNPMLIMPQALCMNARPHVLAHAAKGDAASCAEVLATHLRLIRATNRTGQYLIGLLVANAGDANLLQSLQHVLSVVQFGEPQLAALQHQLAMISLGDAAKAMQQERVAGSHTMRHMTLEQIRGMYQFHDVLPFSSAPEKLEEAARSILVIAIACRPQGWKLADGAGYAEFMLDEVEPCINEVAGTILRTRVAAMEAAVERTQKDAGRLSMLREMPSFAKLLLSAAKHQAMAREALLWCAIERFHLKHGRLPGTLDELAPEFLDKVPCDPVNGLPLRYVRKGERDYLLYSIGWNEKDDGGVETKKREQGDWVWASNPKLIVNLDEEREKAEAKASEERAAQRKAKKPAAKLTPAK